MKKYKFMDWEIEEMDCLALKQMEAIGWNVGGVGNNWRDLVRLCNIEATANTDELLPKSQIGSTNETTH
jgi:hypothetical protein